VAAPLLPRTPALTTALDDARGSTVLLARARVFIVSSAVSSARCADTTPAAVVAPDTALGQASLTAP
jgi:hypothetical protein